MTELDLGHFHQGSKTPALRVSGGPQGWDSKGLLIPSPSPASWARIPSLPGTTLQDKCGPWKRSPAHGWRP